MSLLPSRLFLVIGACSNKTVLLLTGQHLRGASTCTVTLTLGLYCVMLLFDSRVYMCDCMCMHAYIMHYTLVPKIIDTLRLSRITIPLSGHIMNMILA